MHLDVQITHKFMHIITGGFSGQNPAMRKFEVKFNWNGAATYFFTFPDNPNILTDLPLSYTILLNSNSHQEFVKKALEA
jgi:hypothetical protein